MALKPGTICQIAYQRFWLLFPTAASARSAFTFGRRTVATFCANQSSARNWSRSWSSQLKCNVTFIEPCTVIMVVDEFNDTDGVRCQIKVVDSDGNFGWINVMLYTDDQLSESFKPLSETG